MKRSSWDALCRERDEEELREDARKAIEKTYEEVMESYKVALAERYKEDMTRMAKRIAGLEARNGVVNGGVKGHSGAEEKLVIAEERIRDLETKVDCLKLILAGRITDRERVQYHGDDEDRSATSWANEAALEAKEKLSYSTTQAPKPIPTGPRIILHRNENTPFNNPRPTPHAIPGIIPRPHYAPRMTTERLVAESRSRRRAIYITNLGPNFLLKALLTCITHGPLERIVPYPYRGTCLLIFIHAAHAQAFFVAGNSRTGRNPFAGKFQANVGWADQAIARMDYYVASRIVECGATRIVKFTGLETGWAGGGAVEREEVLEWWGGKNSYLIEVKVVEVEGKKEAVVECESVRDAWWRVQEVTMKVKEGKLKVGWEWVQDYCGAGVVDGK